MSTALNFPTGTEVNFLFTTSREIQKYHRRYLNKKSPTDVITFVNDTIDIVISLDQASKQARARDLSPSHEVVLLMCHGLLHAKGFDDLSEREALKMRKAEFEMLMKSF